MKRISVISIVLSIALAISLIGLGCSDKPAEQTKKLSVASVSISDDARYVEVSLYRRGGYDTEIIYCRDACQNLYYDDLVVRSVGPYVRIERVKSEKRAYTNDARAAGLSEGEIQAGRAEFERYEQQVHIGNFCSLKEFICSTEDYDLAKKALFFIRAEEAASGKTFEELGTTEDEMIACAKAAPDRRLQKFLADQPAS